MYPLSVRRFTMTWLVSMVALVAIGIIASSAALAQSAKWKMHVGWVEQRPEAQAYKEFAQRVNAKLAPTFQIDVFPGGTLGVKEADMLRVLPTGNVVPIAAVYPGYMTRDEKVFELEMPPGAISSPKAMVDALPALMKVDQEIYDKWGIQLLAYGGHPVRETHIACREPVNTLEKLRTKKVRVWERFQIETFKALGVPTQIIGQGDLYLALQTGVVDCATYTAGYAKTISLQEVAPYFSYLHAYVMAPHHIIVSKKAFEGLPQQVQKVVREEAKATEVSTMARYLDGSYEKQAIAELVKSGAKIIQPFPKKDQDAYQKAAETIWARESKALGGLSARSYDMIMTAIKK